MKRSVLKLAMLSLAFAGAIGVAHAESKPAVETLPSGIRIEHLQIGTGAQPSPGSAVTVHYVGTFANGEVFDSSYSRNQPATFALNRVVPCWTQAIPHIKVGGNARIYCPAETAYGSRGAGNVIPPNTPLTFDVKLLAIQEP